MSHSPSDIVPAVYIIQILSPCVLLLPVAEVIKGWIFGSLSIIDVLLPASSRGLSNSSRLPDT